MRVRNVLDQLGEQHRVPGLEIAPNRDLIQVGSLVQVPESRAGARDGLLREIDAVGVEARLGERKGDPSPLPTSRTRFH